MKVILVILMVLAALGALGALIRGVVIFLQTSKADLAGPGPNTNGLRQNQMMRARILFQALAVIFAILLMMLARSG